MLQFTRAVAADWAVHKITVNAILPGGFMTEPNQRWSEDSSGGDRTFPRQHPAGRFRPAGGSRAARGVPGQRRLALHDRRGPGDRWRVHVVVGKWTVTHLPRVGPGSRSGSMDRLHRGRFFEDGGNGPRLAGCVGGDVFGPGSRRMGLLVGWTWDRTFPGLPCSLWRTASLRSLPTRCAAGRFPGESPSFSPQQRGEHQPGSAFSQRG